MIVLSLFDGIACGRVAHVISGFIPLKTNENYSFQINLETGYTNHISNTQRYKALGNGWQVDTIVHIFQCLKQWGTL